MDNGNIFRGHHLYVILSRTIGDFNIVYRVANKQDNTHNVPRMCPSSAPCRLPHAVLQNRYVRLLAEARAYSQYWQNAQVLPLCYYSNFLTNFKKVGSSQYDCILIDTQL